MPPKRVAAASSSAMQERLSRSFRRIPAEDTPRLFRLRLVEIELNPDQPRRHVDEDALRELAQSIEQHGLIQPITVQRLPEAERYRLVAGERRFRAHQILGRDDILAVVTAGSPDEISLIENIQREDLHPLEEAMAYARMMERHGWTQEQLAQVVGKARPTITNILKLNSLPDVIRAEATAPGNVPASKSLLFEIARLETTAQQMALWEQVRAGGTVRAARAKAKGATPVPTPPSPLKASVATGRRFLDALRKIRPEEAAEQPTTVRELLKLRDDVNATLYHLGLDPAPQARRRDIGRRTST